MNKNTTQTPTDGNRYVWEHAFKEIDNYLSQTKSRELEKAWTMAQRIIGAQASMYRGDVSAEVAQAYAWEDFEMACRGVGQPGIGGAIFHLWSRTSRRDDKTLQNVLTEGFRSAVAATDPAVLRYGLGVRNTPIATLDKGFGKREVSPSSGFGGTGSDVMDDDLGALDRVLSTPAPKKADDVAGRPTFMFTVIPGGKTDTPKSPAVPPPPPPRKSQK